VALLNDARFAANKPPLGFLTPLLYHLGNTNPAVFYDITTGQRNSQGNCNGFRPSKGWDAISGWGGLNFAEMKKAVLAM
jgi:tripeptidyl-peptidase-1